MVKMWMAKANVGLEIKIQPRNYYNGEKCAWLKQMRAGDEKHVSNKWWPKQALMGNKELSLPSLTLRLDTAGLKMRTVFAAVFLSVLLPVQGN